ncbi:cytochrome P450 [Nemania sp. FL0916]|nr:cytochrome P450 [Nemania sp. FL0916]
MASVHDISGGAQGAVLLGATGFKVLLVLGVLYLITYPIYALYLHPLRSYPGPRLAAITRIPYWWAHVTGQAARWQIRNHQKYGPVVRYGPDDLSFTDAQAWRDIYTVQKGRLENVKEFKMPGRPDDVQHMVTERSAARHGTVRRVFSPAFSEQALRRQEPMFQKYADLMVASARKSGTCNMTELYDFTTFDIMAEFTFGESLGQLENNQYSGWVEMSYKGVKTIPIMQFIMSNKLTKNLFEYLEPAAVKKMRLDYFYHTISRVDGRLQKGSDQPDLWNLVVEADILTKGEMYANAELFMIAGTETTSALLTGLTFYLTRYPEKMKILVDEIRGRFRSNSEITFEALSKLGYLNACLREGLRIYPPAASAQPRVMAKGGNQVMGKWLPEGTRASVQPLAAYWSPENFRNPMTFAPERWLGDPEYKDDNRDAHQPFSVGTRNCIGMSMAWHEARLLLAKIIFNFDIESDVGADWTDQKIFVLWDRKPLVCTFKDVRGTA